MNEPCEVCGTANGSHVGTMHRLDDRFANLEDVARRFEHLVEWQTSRVASEVAMERRVAGLEIRSATLEAWSNRFAFPATRVPDFVEVAPAEQPTQWPSLCRQDPCSGDHDTDDWKHRPRDTVGNTWIGKTDRDGTRLTVTAQPSRQETGGGETVVPPEWHDDCWEYRCGDAGCPAENINTAVAIADRAKAKAAEVLGLSVQG